MQRTVDSRIPRKNGDLRRVLPQIKSLYGVDFLQGHFNGPWQKDHVKSPHFPFLMADDGQHRCAQLKE